MHLHHQSQQPEGPNPVANGGYYYPGDGCFPFFGFLVILFLMAVESMADRDRRPLRRRSCRPVDPEQVAPLRCRRSDPRPHPIRSGLRGFLLGAFAAAFAFACAPLAGEAFAALWPPFSIPSEHGAPLDVALTTLLVLLLLWLAVLLRTGSVRSGADQQVPGGAGGDAAQQRSDHSHAEP